MSEQLKRAVRRAWGTDEQFYKELEAFHKKHERADIITYDNETGLPIKAEYYFQPLQVYRERVDLMMRIAEENAKANEL